MSTALKIQEPEVYDRPAWIPPYITHDWDTDPYAYQTEEELMPAGGPHGKLLGYLMEILRSFTESHGQMLLMDVFMLYRDKNGIKRRVAPDLLLMPFHPIPPSAYDLDEEPPPLGVVEVTSPKSRLNDMKKKVSFYTGLGIPAYLVIDAVTSQGRPRKETDLYLWRKIKGRARIIQPDAEGYLVMPEMNLKVKARGNQLIFADSVTGELLHDTWQLKQYAKADRKRAAEAEKTAEAERKKAEAERKKARKLADKLRELGIDPESI
ncbi:MAG: Uma2 family endonuclease [Desulfobacterales bacterium]|nr:Uma2 family endonuclease [Desulfobacterales bacterium]